MNAAIIKILKVCYLNSLLKSLSVEDKEDKIPTLEDLKKLMVGKVHI